MTVGAGDGGPGGFKKILKTMTVTMTMTMTIEDTDD